MSDLTTTAVRTISVHTDNGFVFEIADLGYTTALTISVDGVIVEECDSVFIELQDLVADAQFSWVEHVFDGSVVHRNSGMITSVSF